MEFIDFRDTCTIERANGGKDNWDNQSRDIIYEGKCCYQEGGTSTTRIFTTRNPTLFLPVADGSIRINDRVVVVTEFGREIRSVAKAVRDINLAWQAGLKVTRIELKQAQGE